MKILTDPKAIASLYPILNASDEERDEKEYEFNMNVLLYLACTRGFHIKLTEYVVNSIGKSMARELEPLVRRAKIAYTNSNTAEEKLPERLKFAFDLYEDGYGKEDFFEASAYAIAGDVGISLWQVLQERPDPKPGKPMVPNTFFPLQNII